MVKTIRKLGRGWSFLKLIKSIYKKSTANIITNSEKLNAFLLRLGSKHGYSPSFFLFNIVLEILLVQYGKKMRWKVISQKRRNKIIICRWYENLCRKFPRIYQKLELKSGGSKLAGCEVNIQKLTYLGMKIKNIIPFIIA